MSEGGCITPSSSHGVSSFLAGYPQLLSRVRPFWLWGRPAAGGTAWLLGLQVASALCPVLGQGPPHSEPWVETPFSLFNLPTNSRGFSKTTSLCITLLLFRECPPEQEAGMDVGPSLCISALKGHSPELLTVQFLETVVSSILLIFLIILAGEYIQYQLLQRGQK